jgi:hypothetical protein
MAPSAINFGPQSHFVGLLKYYMTPCSAWCHPSKGVHVFVSAMRTSDGSDLTIEEARSLFLGSNQVSSGSRCLQRGVRTIITNIEAASEVPLTDGYNLMVLTTVQVEGSDLESYLEKPLS